MIISQLNSIRFRKVDGNNPNFDNTLLQDEKFWNDSIFTYCQRWKNTDTEKVMIESDSDTVPTVIATKADNTTEVITASLVTSYDQDNDSVNDLFYFTFSVDFSLFTLETYITVTQGAVVYKSEPFKGDSNLATEISNNNVLVIEYFNVDNAFGIDFSSGAGSITYTLYVESKLKDYDFGGELSVYDNQSEFTKLKETVQRIFAFQCENIPRYLAETLRLASSVDNFAINDISYVRQDLPELTPIEWSNLVDFNMTLNDKEYLGINSHDIGFDCDTTGGNDMVLSQDNASGSVTFSIPAGWQVHTLRAQFVSGTPEIKLGLSVGTDELVYPFTLGSGESTVAIHGDVDRDTTTNIYATVTGGVVNLDVQIIKNIQ